VPLHCPATHTSSVVHREPSVQLVPSGACTSTQLPVASSQTDSTHWRASLVRLGQVMGVPLQMPASHLHSSSSSSSRQTIACGTALKFLHNLLGGLLCRRWLVAPGAISINKQRTLEVRCIAAVQVWPYLPSVVQWRLSLRLVPSGSTTQVEAASTAHCMCTSGLACSQWCNSAWHCRLCHLDSKPRWLICELLNKADAWLCHICL
jgi:hypothetical protein